MASSRCSWLALFLLSLMTRDVGVFGRVLDPLAVLSRAPGTGAGSTLRTDAPRRRAEPQCAELAAPWLQSPLAAPEGQEALQLQIRVRPLNPGPAPGPVFPGKPLFSFVRRVYRCCQEGGHCRSVKGIQGRMRGGSGVDFLLSRDVLSLTVLRAELHLQLSNPQHLDIRPVLMSMVKRELPTRYSWWSRGTSLELRVDLLLLLQTLQEATGSAGGAPSLVKMRQVESPSRWGDGVYAGLPALDLGLVLGCSQAGSGVPCGPGGIHLLHTPFMALHY